MERIANAQGVGSLNITAPIEGISSYQEIQNWQDFSELKTVVSNTTKNIEILKAGGGILSDDGILWKTESVDIEDKKITVRGIDAIKMHNNQAVRGQHTISAPDAGYSNMLLAAAAPGRDLLTVNFPANFPALPAPMQISWGHLGDALIKLALAGTFGYTPRKNAGAGYMYSDAYLGIDRTLPQNMTGLFSDQIDNIDTIRILDDISSYKNFAVVAGEGEGAARIWTTVDIRTSSLEPLRELFVDARDLQKRYTKVDANGSTSEGIYTDSEYLEVLRSRGREKLAEAKRKNPVSIKATDSSIMQYGIDYALGDIVSVRLEKYHLDLTARVSSIYTVLEGGSKTATPSLSDFKIIGE